MSRVVSWTNGLARIRELADIEGTSGQGYISDAKLMAYADASRGAWHSKLVQCDPERFATYGDITADGSNSYTLPVDHYATLFMERVNGTDHFELVKAGAAERNNWGNTNANASAYWLVENTVRLIPIPTSGTYRHWYVRRANRFVVADTTFTTTNATELVNSTAHGLATGDGPIRLRTTNYDLPNGYTTDTDYWVVYSTTNAFKLATSYDNAIAGTVVSISDDGTGTHTYYGYVDGINGWEEWIWLDVAIKVLLKQRSDISMLQAAQVRIEQEMLQAAANRVKGDTTRVQDMRHGRSRFGRFGMYPDPDFWSYRT